MTNHHANQPRRLVVAKRDDAELGPLKLLPGVWRNLPNLPGRGWNMIALPFLPDGGGLNYRLLLNQFNEELEFFLVDKGVPNRGLSHDSPQVNLDQSVVTLDYEQEIDQIAVEDRPESGKAGNPGAKIHHEPGLWLHMLNHLTDELDIARLATIPHGDSVLALGKSNVVSGAPTIPATNGLPVGVPQDLNSRYLEPYKHYHDNPFQGVFDPTEPHKLLEAANQGVTIQRTTELEVDTRVGTGGISNIPFIVKHANAASMKSTFWIQELAEEDDAGRPKLRLQYLQVVMLDFHKRRDGLPGLISWPHVSINTMEWVSESPDYSNVKP